MSFITLIFSRKPSKVVFQSAPPSWEDWNLDREFLQSLSEHSRNHPESKLDRVLAGVSELLEAGRDYHDAIPDGPFPAKSLVIALSSLVQLGITITRAKESVREFVEQVAAWVEAVSSALEADVNGGNFNWMTWRSLRKSRDLINEICVWAQSRLADGRWSQIKHGLMVGKEIEDFNIRLAESRRLFQDLSLIHITGGIDALKATLKSIFLHQDVILDEIQKIKKQQKEQLSYIINKMEVQEQAEIRRAFLAENLDAFVVATPSFNKQGKNPCDKDTRVEELAVIQEWLHANTPGSQNFLWLTGDPGCGKSAITASLAEYCLNRPDRVLLTQFFINRNNKDTTDPNSYFPSIARQLANKCPAVEQALYNRLKNQPGLVIRISSEQAMNLFVDALAVAAKSDEGRIIAVVIDGLDETDQARLRDTAKIFSELFGMLLKYPNVKIFISSRTEDEIRNPFARNIKDANVKQVHLDTYSSINDVALFLRRNVGEIVEQYDLNWEVWPREDRIAALGERASGLFIWAVTALRYIQERIEEDGQECLNRVLDELTGEALTGINALYKLILQSKQKAKPTEWDYKKFRRIIGAIITLKEPLCLDDLTRLLDLRGGPDNEPADIIHFVRRLRTVLVAGTDAIDGETVPRLHKSFFEFITDSDLFQRISFDHRFCVDLTEAEAELGISCLERLADAAEDETWPSGSLQYAFRFYYSHAEAVTGGTPGLVLCDQTEKVDCLESLYSTVRQSGIPIPRYCGVVDKPSVFSPLGAVYLSSNSSKRRLVNTAPSRVWSLAFSPNGEQLISGLKDGSIILWEVQTGTELGRFNKGHTKQVCSVAFSPSGDRIASGSYDHTIRIWDVQTRESKSILRRHSDLVRSVAFSHDGTLLASASNDKTVRLWDAFSGKPITSFSHEDLVSKVVFTPDLSQVITGTLDGCVHIWDRQAGKLQQKLTSSISRVYSLSISPFGDCLAAIGDGGVSFWNRSVGGFVLDDKLSFKLGRSKFLFHISFSPDGKSVVLWHNADNNPTLHLYILQSRVKIQFPSTPNIYGFTLSPSASSVAFNDDNQIYVWPVPRSTTLTALSPNGKLVLSAFLDGTIWLGIPKELPVANRQLGKVNNLKYISFSSDSAFLATVDNDSLYLWDISSLKIRARSSSKKYPPVTSLSFLHDRHTLVSFHGDDSVYAWTVADDVLVPQRMDTSSSECIDLDPPVTLDIDHGHAQKVAGAKWFPAKKEGSDFIAYINDCLIRRKAVDGSIILLPFKPTGGVES